MEINVPKIQNSRNLSEITTIKELPQQTPVVIPANSQLYLGRNYLLDTRSPYLKQLLDKKKSVVVGSNNRANIQTSKFYNGVSPFHLVLSKKDDKIVAKNLSSEKGTLVIPKNKITPFVEGTTNLKLAQGNIGDCYLLATLYSLSRTENGQKLLKDMVKIDNDGNYIVNFNGTEIKVNTDELYGETYIDGTKKKCVDGDLAISAIERAYAKLIKKDGKSANFIELNKGGFPNIALENIVGIKSTVHNLKFERNLLENICKNGIENYVLTCTTPPKKYGKHLDIDEKFIPSHAYCIKSINSNDKSVEIVNPHNTKKSEIITFDEFYKTFDRVFCAKI